MNERDNIETLITSLLYEVGEDPKRSELKGTPERVAKMYRDKLSGYEQDLENMLGELEEGRFDGPILVRGLSVESTCECHLLPILAEVCVSYVPDGNAASGGGVKNLIEGLANRLQTPARLAEEIADALESSALGPRGVFVEVDAHCCCEGGLRTTAIAERGVLRSEQ